MTMRDKLIRLLLKTAYEYGRPMTELETVNAILTALPSMIPDLVWSEHCEPNRDHCSYDHVKAEVDGFTLTIEWKSWKKYDSYCCQMQNGDYLSELTLEAAKAAVDAHHRAALCKAMGLAS